MTSKLVTSLYAMMVLLMSSHIYPAWCFHIAIQPEEVVEGRDSSVDVTCIVDGPELKISRLITMSIFQGYQKFLAIIDSNSPHATYGKDVPSNYQVTGSVQGDITKSSLTLTITSPKKNNTGDYSCVVYFINQVGLLSEARITKRLTVTVSKVDCNSTQEMETLANRVSSLEFLVAKQNQVIETLLEAVNNTAPIVDMVRDLETRVVGVEADNADTASTLHRVQLYVNDTSQSDALKILESRTSHLEQSDVTISTALETVRQTEQDLRDEIGNLRNTSTGKFKAVEDKINNGVITELQDFKAKQAYQTQKIWKYVTNVQGFSATSDDSLRVTEGETIVFPVTTFSRGAGYDTKTGVFTAPSAGLYVFYLTITANTGTPFNVKLKAAGKTVAKMFDLGYEQVTVTAVLPLDHGQAVWPVLSYIDKGHSSATIVNKQGDWSKFEGYLLTANIH